MPSFPKGHGAEGTHWNCNKHTSADAICCGCQPRDCEWTQPLGMSGEEKWWEEEKYLQRSSPYDAEYDIPAILKEQRRLVIEEGIETAKEESVRWFKSRDRSYSNPHDDLIDYLKSL